MSSNHPKIVFDMHVTIATCKVATATKWYLNLFKSNTLMCSNIKYNTLDSNTKHSTNLILHMAKRKYKIFVKLGKDKGTLVHRVFKAA